MVFLFIRINGKLVDVIPFNGYADCWDYVDSLEIPNKRELLLNGSIYTISDFN